MTNRFTVKAQSVLNNSLRLARELGHTYIGSEHLLLSLASETDSVAAKLLEKRGATPDAIREEILREVGEGTHSDVTPADMTPRTKRIIEHSAMESHRTGQSYIGTEHLLAALLAERDSVAVKILESLHISSPDLAQDLSAFFGASAQEGGAREGNAKEKKKESTLKDAPTLAQYGRDLTAMAKAGKIDPVIGRDAETERVIQILSRRQKNNPCLVGEPGVGKTAVVEGLAQKIADGTVPETLKDKQIVTVDVAAMIAGAKYRANLRSA